MTLIVKLCGIVGVFCIASFVYYLPNKGDSTKSNIFYETGKLIDEIYFE